MIEESINLTKRFIKKPTYYNTMKKLQFILILFAFNLALTNSKAQTKKTICYNVSVPKGYVIIGNAMESSCPNFGSYAPNANVIDLAKDNLEICYNSPIPEEYVFVASLRSLSCNTLGTATTNNAMILKKALDKMEICYDSPIPNGFRVIYYGNGTQCSNYTATGKNTKIISNK